MTVRREDVEAIEVSRASLYAALDRPRIERMVAGALTSAIDAHGPLTRDKLGSATKRIMNQLATPDGRSGCPYCQERLRVNVGLLMENTELKRGDATRELESERDLLQARVEATTAERDHWIRLFNRLETAVRRHSEASHAHGFADESVDDALHSAWRSVMKTAALGGSGDEGKG